MTKTLICSAWGKEIHHLKQQELDASYELATLGIGYLDAALELERILLEKPGIEKVIFIGTAGAYSKTIELGSLVQVTRVGLLNFGTIEQKAYIPKPYEEFHCQSSFDKKIKKAICLSSLEITQDTKVSKKVMDALLSRDIVENMEFYGVAKVARKHNKIVSALLGVTNYTNIDARTDWQEQQEEVSKRLCDEVVKLLLSKV